MADFEQKMLWLAERGTHVGPEELINRVEHELVGHPRVVVTGQRKARPMTRTDKRTTTTSTTPPRRGFAWAVVAFVAVLLVGAAIFAGSRIGNDGDVVDTTPSTVAPSTTVAAPTTTVAPPTTAAPPTTESALEPAVAQDVALVEAAFAAWYGGDFDAVSQLLAIPGGSEQHSSWTVDDTRDQVAYDTLSGSRAEGLACEPPGAQGESFECVYSTANAFTDAIGLEFDPESPNERADFRVEDGRVVEYEFADNSYINRSFGTYLALIGEFDGYELCFTSPLNVQCAQTQLDHVDGWAEWALDPMAAESLLSRFVEEFFTGDCLTAHVINGVASFGNGGLSGSSFFDTSEISALVDSCGAAVDYERALGGTLQLGACQTERDVRGTSVTCEGGYSNALNEALGAPPMPRQVAAVVLSGGTGWPHESLFVVGDHPEDKDLMLSLRRWALDAGLSEAMVDACGTRGDKTPECATFLLDNLDAWAAWYPDNS